MGSKRLLNKKVGEKECRKTRLWSVLGWPHSAILLGFWLGLISLLYLHGEDCFLWLYCFNVKKRVRLEVVLVSKFLQSRLPFAGKSLSLILSLDSQIRLSLLYVDFLWGKRPLKLTWCGLPRETSYKHFPIGQKKKKLVVKYSYMTGWSRNIKSLRDAVSEKGVLIFNITSVKISPISYEIFMYGLIFSSLTFSDSLIHRCSKNLLTTKFFENLTKLSNSWHGKKVHIYLFTCANLIVLALYVQDLKWKTTYPGSFGTSSVPGIAMDWLVMTVVGVSMMTIGSFLTKRRTFFQTNSS